MAETIIYGIKIGDLIQAGAVLVASFGLFLNIIEHKKTNTLTRIKIVSNTLDDIYNNQNLSDIFYKIITTNPKKIFNYNKKFHGSIDEKNLDHLLFKLELLSKLYFEGILELKDFEIIKEIFIDIYDNENVQKYLNYLDSLYIKKYDNNPYFNSFRALAKIFKNESSLT